MQDFTNNLIAATGLDASTAKAAIGEVLLFLRDKAPQGRVAEYVASTPQAQEAVKAAESAGDRRLAQIIEGLTRFTGHGRADVNVLIGELIGLGLDETQIRRVFDETLSRAEDLLGAAGVREVRDMLFGAPAPAQPTTAAPIIVPLSETPATKSLGDAQADAHRYRARETVGVFSDEETLETAVDELNVAGFRDAAISVLATARQDEGRPEPHLPQCDGDRGQRRGPADGIRLQRLARGGNGGADRRSALHRRSRRGLGRIGGGRLARLRPRLGRRARRHRRGSGRDPGARHSHPACAAYPRAAEARRPRALGEHAHRGERKARDGNIKKAGRARCACARGSTRLELRLHASDPRTL